MRRFKVINILNKIPSSTKTIPPVPAAVWRNPFYFIAFGFGSGAIPFAPGTFGTLMAVPFFLVLQARLSLSWYLLFVIIFCILSMVLCGKLSRATNTEDHPGMCIDEFAGFFVTMINAKQGIIWLLLGFLLFRLFDIWKPWPIRLIDEKIHGGFGMVFDDIVAGLFAFVILQFIIMLT